MKNTLRLFILLFISIIIFFSGCKKDPVCDAVLGDWELVN